MSFEKPAVVIDNGSYSIKAGFACDNHPVSIFRTVVGRPNYLNGSYGREPYDVYIGDGALALSEELEISHPVVGGRIVHWDNMERIMHHIFYRELKVAPEDRAVLLACAGNMNLQEKMQFCEMIFETLNAPAFCVQPQGVLALYGSGYTTGIAVDLGYDTADISPVYEGGLMSYAHMTNNLPSSAIANYIKELLAERNIFTSVDVLDDIRNKHVCVTKNAALSRKGYKRTYTLPSGEVVDISNEAFMAGEIMFQPNLVVPDRPDIISLQEAIVTASLKCDPELRQELYDAVVPCGGMSMVPGLCSRVRKPEQYQHARHNSLVLRVTTHQRLLQQLLLSWSTVIAFHQSELGAMIHEDLNVITSDEAYVTQWLGGATFAGMSGSKKMWVTKSQFEDFGFKIVKNKFI